MKVADGRLYEKPGVDDMDDADCADLDVFHRGGAEYPIACFEKFDGGTVC